MTIKVTVIGAGINGLVITLLLRLFGIEAKIYEKAPTLRGEGSGIYLWPQGMQILGTILPKEKILKAGNIIDYIATLTSTNQLLQEEPTQQKNKHFLAPTFGIHRTRLFNLLVTAVGKKNIHLNKNCITVKQLNNSAVAFFADGSKIESDLIIGADGIFSKIRQTIYPEIKINYSRVATSRGMVNFKIPKLDNDRGYIYSSNQARIFTYVSHEKNNERYWFSAYRLPENKPLFTKNEILQRFADYPKHLLEMIAATPEKNIIPSYLYDLNAAQSWSKNNITLVGDAALAMLPTIGYGFILGMENAFILAQALGSNYYSISEALKRFEFRALSRSNKMAAITRKFNQLFYFTEPQNITKEAIVKLYSEFFALAAQTPL